LFQDRKAKKTYLAIVRGIPKLSEARIDLPIERNPKNPATFRIGASGKNAETFYKVLETKGMFSLLELKPTTGRTHQLRVHLAHIGTPIAGDAWYGGGKSPIGRLCLHARELEITLPGGERRTFEAPLPEDFSNWVAS
jgi:23S rRNA-/tRNA-specific pseudouridylate synthase